MKPIHAPTRPRLFAAFAAAAVALAVSMSAAAPAAAQGWQRISVTCESSNRQSSRCGHADGHSPQLERQLSRRACIWGRTWGFDQAGLWVSSGCRGEFSVSVPQTASTTPTTPKAVGDGPPGSIKRGDSGKIRNIIDPPGSAVR